MDIPRTIKDLLDITGWSQYRLAEKLGANQPDISRWLKGSEPKRHNLEALRSLAAQYGLLDDEEGPPATIPIVGWVGAGGEVQPEFEQAPVDGFEQIELPARNAFITRSFVTDPVGLVVEGTSGGEKYDAGSVIIIERDQNWPGDSLIGRDAVVITYDGHRYLKRVARFGSLPYTFELASYDERPPMENVRIRFATPVRMHIPNIGLRRIGPRADSPTRGKLDQRSDIEGE